MSSNDLSSSGIARSPWLPGTSTVQGGFGVAIGAALWGLFWIPLRFLDHQGVTGLWAITLVMLAVVIPAVLWLVGRKQLIALRSFDTWFIGGALGLSTVLYFTGVIVSDVIRVVFLFYLLPVWTTLAARFFYKEPITPIRLVVITTALTGMWLLLGGGKGIPIPSNVGDWCGLLAGICWGTSLALIRGKEDVNAIALIGATGVTAAIIAAMAAAFFLSMGNTDMAALPKVDSWPVVIVTTLGFSILLLYPSLIGQVWGAQRIAAPTAALLTMSEILVATLSAYVLIGTTLNKASMAGAGIILIAVLVDIFMQYKQINPRSVA